MAWKVNLDWMFEPNESAERERTNTDILVDAAIKSVGQVIDWFFEFLKRVAVVGVVGAVAGATENPWAETAYVAAWTALVVSVALPPVRAFIDMDREFETSRWKILALVTTGALAILTAWWLYGLFNSVLIELLKAGSGH
ncbi:hypothetical protein [Brevundimonas sp.]|uniref:hypothetical protein n=1 Tax=Brevundimonas sp. TaxID=1871086 RepID=UPI0011FBC729|nr:hypothetical protein [Brevundimonas sp.]TAJ65189.1 MAG: hypothetical protein EPO49_03880 [Brevundimonas sp.]